MPNVAAHRSMFFSHLPLKVQTNGVCPCRMHEGHCNLNIIYEI